MNTKRVFTCYQCKQIYENPVSLPCGITICQKHIVDQQPCMFCKRVHIKEPLVKNPIFKNLLTLLNESKNANQRLKNQANILHATASKPLEIINSHLDNLKNEVLTEKRRILDFIHAKIDEQTDMCISQIEEYRESCKTSLDVKFPQNPFFEVTKFFGEMQEKINENTTFLKSVCEESWNAIIQTSDSMCQEV